LKNKDLSNGLREKFQEEKKRIGRRTQKKALPRVRAGHEDNVEGGFYLPRRARLEAFKGLIFAWADTSPDLTWVAMLQMPFFHFSEGSGNALQYQPVSISVMREQPLHASTASRQLPPL
jgi:hypothetical protein